MNPTVAAQLAALRGEVRALLDRVRATSAYFVDTSRSSASGEEDATAQQDGVRDAQRNVRRAEPFGLRSRPPTGLRAIVLRMLDGAGVMLGLAQARYGPSDLAEGEVALYCLADGALVKLDAQGAVRVAAAAGQDVVVNSGTLKVARVTDQTSGHTHSVIFALTAPPGGGPVTGTITIVSATDTIAASGGAANFKA